MNGSLEEGLIAVILAGALVWIVRPLRNPARHVQAADDARWRELVETKHALYRSILDLEFDQAVGKVSDADYVFLRRQQEAEALAVLARMDALAAERAAGGPGSASGGGPALDGAPEGDPGDRAAASAEGSLEDRLEAEIAAARSRLRPQGGA